MTGARRRRARRHPARRRPVGRRWAGRAGAEQLPTVRGPGERGSVAVSSLVGVAVLLLFLLLASQALVHLHATSAVTAVAFDSARRASADGAACPDPQVVLDRLGGWGRRDGVSAACERAADGTTVVRIAGPSPAGALGGAASVLGLGGDGGWWIEREAVLHTEAAP